MFCDHGTVQETHFQVVKAMRYKQTTTRKEIKREREREGGREGGRGGERGGERAAHIMTDSRSISLTQLPLERAGNSAALFFSKSTVSRVQAVACARYSSCFTRMVADTSDSCVRLRMEGLAKAYKHSQVHAAIHGSFINV